MIAVLKRGELRRAMDGRANNTYPKEGYTKKARTASLGAGFRGYEERRAIDG